MAVLENNDTDKKDTITEKTSKKSKKKSKKKIEVPKDDILTDKALQRAAEIVEMLTDQIYDTKTQCLIYDAYCYLQIELQLEFTLGDPNLSMKA